MNDHKRSYETTTWTNPVKSDCVVINHIVNKVNGTGWHVQTNFYGKHAIGVAIDRRGFFVFRGNNPIKTLTESTGLTYMCEKLNLRESDAAGLQDYYRWLFSGAIVQDV